jgi:hypothetical protein
MKSQNIRHLKNKFYLKYYMIKAGNDNPKLKKEMDDILAKLEELATGSSRVLRHSKLLK